ncbi:transposase [Spiroplasma poulsonii]|uniref:transposase n=1 Tax=Spiroplasma poulsonii TaxID=2138 RepID=UPI001F4CF0B2|nr:transposase [Spiroplasma poulsonii]UNF62463.1 transposase [Spiroplasma poulsonii]
MIIEYKTINIDATETSNPTPKDKTILFLVKKKHTIKTQVLYRTRNQKLLQTKFSVREKHDYALFKESKSHFKNTKLIVDSGYQGTQKSHNNVLSIYKETKKPFKTKNKSNIIDSASKWEYNKTF